MLIINYASAGEFLGRIGRTIKMFLDIEYLSIRNFTFFS